MLPETQLWKSWMDQWLFASLAKSLREGLTIHSPSALLFFFFKVEISSRTNSTFLGNDQSKMAQWAETTMNKCFLTSYMWACFPDDRFPHYAWSAKSAHSNIIGSRGVHMFMCNLQPALLAEWLGSITCHCGNMDLEQTTNKSERRTLTLEKKILPPFLPGLELKTFQSQVPRSTNKLSWLKVELATFQSQVWCSTNKLIYTQISFLV